jgi:hypothetical protein
MHTARVRGPIRTRLTPSTTPSRGSVTTVSPTEMCGRWRVSAPARVCRTATDRSASTRYTSSVTHRPMWSTDRTPAIISQPSRASFSIVAVGSGSSDRGVGWESKNSTDCERFGRGLSEDETVDVIVELVSIDGIHRRGGAPRRDNLVAVCESVSQVVRICG